MHKTVCIKVEIKPGKTPEKTLAKVMREAENTMHDYSRGHYISWESTPMVKTGILTKDGKKVQACRSTNFERFTSSILPEDLIFNTYIDSYLMSKYRVDWKTVVRREIQDAIDEDDDALQTWFVCYYVKC